MGALVTGVLSVTALVTVYQNEACNECGPSLHPTKTFVIELIWDTVHNFNLSYLCEISKFIRNLNMR